MADYQGVMVYCEVSKGKPAAIATELLGCGRKLADDLGQELIAVLVGSDVDNLAQEVISYGADKVYIFSDPILKDYQTDSYLWAMEKAVSKVMPQILLLGQTSIGRDLTPRLAFRLNTAASMDCVDLAIDPDSKLLLQTRPVYGGNAMAVFTCESFPQIATVRAKAMSPLEPDFTRQGEVITIHAKIDPSGIRTRILEKVKEEVKGLRLEDASVIVSGGRGIGGEEGFRQLEELAGLLHGAVGATRPACDNGWVPAALQIGLTGKIVAPDLYIAVALSGSSQHLTGCYDARNIIAINKDPEANIFNIARLGVVGDWKKVIPALIDVFSRKVNE